MPAPSSRPGSQVMKRRASDARVRWYVGIGLAALVVACYLVFETGRLMAGHNLVEAAAERRAHRQEVGRLQAELSTLREKVTQQATDQKTDKEAYAEVERGLDELQAKIQEQREAIAFYRGIISPADSNAGLRVQDFQVVRGPDEAHYRLRLVLVQAKQHHREIYGSVRLTVDGARNGEVVSYPLRQLLADGERKSWNYGFRYFQDFERDLRLPDGFSPLTVNIELVPKGAGNVGLKQSFPWSTTQQSSSG